MKSRIQFLKAMFYLPVFVALLRLVVTLIVLIWNPLGMSFRFLQLVPALVIGVSVFCYAKLYMEPVPIISLIVPSILQFLFILVFKRTLELAPFLPLFLLDVVFLVVMALKLSFFPFEIDGDEEPEDEYEDLVVED